MSKEKNFLKIKEVRRKLLRNLNILHPSPLRLNSLYNSICQLNYDKGFFVKDITYFYNRQWIEFVDDQIGGEDDFFDKVIKLTKAGQKIAEGMQEI